MRHFLFEITDEESENCGEELIVGADNIREAYRMAKELFGRCQSLGELTEEEAENSGLDEY